MRTLTEIAHALSSPIRTALVAMPTNETLGEAALRLGVTPSTISYHVAVLEDAGLVIVDRVGSRRYLRRRHRELRIVLGDEPEPNRSWRDEPPVLKDGPVDR